MKEYCVFYFPQDSECKVKDFDSSSAMRIFLQQNIENKMIPCIGFIGGNMKMLYTCDKCTDKELVEKMTDYLVEEQRKKYISKRNVIMGFQNIRTLNGEIFGNGDR